MTTLRSASEAFQVGDRALEQQGVGLLVGNRAVFDGTGHNLRQRKRRD